MLAGGPLGLTQSSHFPFQVVNSLLKRSGRRGGHQQFPWNVGWLYSPTSLGQDSGGIKSQTEALPNRQCRLGILTDIGVITDHVIDQYSRCNALFVESNHDIDMLWSGNDPQYLKSRVSGDLGHLSNDQTKNFIGEVLHDRLNTIAIGHISQRNNRMDLLYREYAELMHSCTIEFATQEEGTSWQSAT